MCVQVEVLPESSSGAHKFKVVGIAVNDVVPAKDMFFFGADHDDYSDNRSG